MAITLKLDPTTTKLGWIGTGVMGRWMCQHLMDLVYGMTVYNRTKSKADPLLEAGAAWADHPVKSQQLPMSFSRLSDSHPMCERFISAITVSLKGAKSGSIVVDMTTTEPSLAQEIYAAAQAQDVASVDAPVSGGDVGAKEARLSIMVGGDEDAVQAVMPLFEAMGKNIVHQGGAGAGQHTKMCNQITISGTMIGVCEGLIYGHKAGLDLETMLSSISGGAAACWSLDNLAPRVLQRTSTPASS